ncbi:hypothetical protein NDN08_006711 [Rhodosorus marinus]|uniref:F-box domain-containing protein n=1 Tax=Rhodosorus marinus TaxID=101924 RepID=A0AAV8UJV7_9RHOD|nr:hypothetical protein NDN08_006711 [Rhodosorus marinus]
MTLALDSALRSLVADVGETYHECEGSPYSSGETSSWRGFNSMTDAELDAEIDAHGDFGISRKRRASRIVFLETCGRAKYARREDEELTCSLNDELWDRIVCELLEQDLLGAMQLRRVNRQLERVVSRSGLWARMLERLVADMEIVEDGTSVKTSTGTILSWSACEEAIKLIRMVLPPVCFGSLVFGGEKVGHEKYEGIAGLHSRGFLSAKHDRVAFLFQMVGKRTFSEIKSLGKIATIEFREQNGMMAVQPVSPRLILKRVFERVSKRGSSLREVFEQVLRNKKLLRLRWAEFEKILEGGGNLALKGCALHEGYAQGRLDLEEAVRLIRYMRERIEFCLREKRMESGLLGHGYRLNALSSGSTGFIQNRNTSGTMQDVVDNTLEMAFYSERTPYIFLRETLDPSGEDFEVSEMIEKALTELLDAGPIAVVPQTRSSGLVADELVDRTEACKFLRRVALFWFVLALPSTGRVYQENEIPLNRTITEFRNIHAG